MSTVVHVVSIILVGKFCPADVDTTEDLARKSFSWLAGGVTAVPSTKLETMLKIRMSNSIPRDSGGSYSVQRMIYEDLKMKASVIFDRRQSLAVHVWNRPLVGDLA